MTNSLAVDLQEIGDGDFSVILHRFVHEGRHLDNVEAELPGTSPHEIVMISAHLDATAAFSHEPGAYEPARHSAPGADDDASGIAAVLVIAGALRELAHIKRPKRTLRFTLFNAEEHGLVGSKTYARAQAAAATPIVAVFQMDMIGFNKEEPRSFEVHVGTSSLSGDVQARSLALAERMKSLVEQVSPRLGMLQIYTDPDPAAGRSDHASFHERGYAACAVSEDFWFFRISRGSIHMVASGHGGNRYM